jgi:HEAT repeat protein
MNPAELLYLIVVVLFLSVAMIVTLLVERRKTSIAKKKFAALSERLADYAVGSGKLPAAKGSHDMLFALKELKERVQFDREKAESIVSMIDDAGITARYVRRLRSCRSDRRIEAVSYLSVIGSETALSALRTKLSSERSYQVKLFIISGLAEFGDKESIPVMAESLRKAPPWYRERAHGVLMSFGIDILPYVLENLATEDREIRGFALHCAGKIPHPKLREFLLQSSRSEDEPLARAAVAVMGSLYADELRTVSNLKHPNPHIRRSSVHSLASSPDRETLELLFDLSEDREIGKELSFSISSILRKNPSLLPDAVRRFNETENTRCGAVLAEALSERIDYLLYFLRFQATRRDL